MSAEPGASCGTGRVYRLAEVMRVPGGNEGEALALGEADVDVWLCFYETPFSPTVTCRFRHDNQLLFDVRGNVGFGPAERPQLEGALRR